MSTCLNIKPEELRPYKELGLTISDISVDYMQYGKLRSPKAIKYKLDNIKPVNLTAFVGNNSNIVDSFNSTEANSWVEKLSKALNVPYEIVSLNQAQEIHRQSSLPYNNEPAFFKNGKVYFVEGMLNTDIAVHEFSHPLIKALALENPTVFNSLFDNLVATPEGKALYDTVLKAYPNSSVDSLKEETLVNALQQTVAQEQPWYKEILFQIKQLLRKLIGKKIEVHKMTADTTLKDLSDMLRSGEKIELNYQLLSAQDVVEHFRNLDDFYNTFDQIDNTDYDIIQKAINDVFNNVRDNVSDVQDTELYGDIADLLVNEYNQGILDEIKSLLKDEVTDNRKIVSAINEKHQGMHKLTSEQVRDRLSNFTLALFKAKDLFATMKTSVNNITDLSDFTTCDKILNYKKYISQWSSTIETLSTSLTDVSSDNPLKELLRTLNSDAADVVSKIQKLELELATELVYDNIQPTVEKLKDTFKKKLTKMKRNHASQRMIDNAYVDMYNLREEEYTKYKAMQASGNTSNAEYQVMHAKFLRGISFETKDQVRDILKGLGNDMSTFNGLYESLNMSSDPIAHTLFEHIKDNRDRFTANAKAQEQKFIMDLQEFSSMFNERSLTNGDIGKLTTFKNKKARKVSKVDANGHPYFEVEVYEEHTFLNDWKDYEVDKLQHTVDVENAEMKYRITHDPKDRTAYYNARYRQLKWTQQYMNQTFMPEYYNAELLLLQDELGHDTLDLYETHTKKLKDLQNLNDDGSLDIEVENMRNQINELSNVFDINGNKKTGRDLEIAERLKEYFNLLTGFTNEDEIPGAFQTAYNDYVDSLLTSGLTPNDNSYHTLLDTWLRKNTRVALKNSVYDQRKVLIDRRKKLTETLDAANKAIFDTSDHLTFLNESAKNVTEQGASQPNGNRASSVIRSKVKAAHEAIENAKEKLLSATGLNGAERKRFQELKNLYHVNEKVWPDLALKDEFDKLTAKASSTQNSLNIDSNVLSELKSIDEALAQLTSKNVTSQYGSTLESFVINNADVNSKFAEFINRMGYTGTPYASDYLDFINSTEGKEAMALDSSFNTFVTDNHYEVERFDNDQKKIITELKATDIWMFNLSNDPFDYKTKMLKDVNGKNIGLIEIDGTYRIPASKYYSQYIKPQYETEQIVGDTVDNKGNFLPKDEPTGKYRNEAYTNLKQDDPETFKLLETLKDNYLSMQERGPKNDRLYMAIPKIRGKRIENVQRSNYGPKYFGRRVREFLNGAADDAVEYGNLNFVQDNINISHTESLFNDDTEIHMPVHGVNDIHLDDVSLNVLATIPQYFGSLMTKSAAAEANGFAQVVKSVLQNEGQVNDKFLPGIAAKNLYRNTGNIYQDYKKDEDKHVRLKVVNELIKRDIQGETLTGALSEYRQLVKLTSEFGKITSKAAFSLDIISGMKNSIQMKTSALEHALAGDYMTVGSLAKAQYKSVALMAQISARQSVLSTNRRNIKTKDERLFNLFDPSNGRTHESFGDTFSVTIIGDIVNGEGKYLQRTRKWLELNGTCDIYYAVMLNTKVKVTTNGVTKTVPYTECFTEDAEGNMITIPGVESKYEVTFTDGNYKMGKGFTEVKNKIQVASVKFNGANAKYDQPLIARNYIAKNILYLQKYIIPFISKSFIMQSRTHKASILGVKLGKYGSRVNWSTGETELGMYPTAIRFMRDLVLTLGSNLKYATSSEIKGVRYVLSQVVVGMLLRTAASMLLPLVSSGYDDDDEEKIGFNYMRYRSGIAPAPFTTVDNHDFHLQGYMLNMATALMYEAELEHSTATPVNWKGFNKDYMLVNSKSLALQQISVSSGTKMFTDLFNIVSKYDTEEGGYQKDAGPFVWQQEGYKNGKLINLLLKLNLGIKGNIVDPTKRIQNKETFRKMEGTHTDDYSTPLYHK